MSVPACVRGRVSFYSQVHISECSRAGRIVFQRPRTPEKDTTADALPSECVCVCGDTKEMRCVAMKDHSVDQRGGLSVRSRRDQRLCTIHQMVGRLLQFGEDSQHRQGERSAGRCA